MDFGVAFYVEKPIKTASEISRINFRFVTLFYCLYNICIPLIGGYDVLAVVCAS